MEPAETAVLPQQVVTTAAAKGDPEDSRPGGCHHGEHGDGGSLYPFSYRHKNQDPYPSLTLTKSTTAQPTSVFALI